MIEKNKKYQVLILGSGPAGYTASIYLWRYGISNAVIGSVLGGLASEAHKVCNYPSEDEIRGFELMNKMKQKVTNSGGEIIFGQINRVEKIAENFKVILENDQEFIANKIILATGSEYIRLGIENEKKYLGKGISYCYTCDGMFSKDKISMVVGSGNNAVMATMYLSQVASRIYLVSPDEKLKADKSWLDQLDQVKNLEIRYNSRPEKLLGAEKLEKVILDNDQKIDIDNLFVEIGHIPATKIAQDLGVKLDKQGYIVVNSAQKTNQKNIWAAGDVTTGSNKFRQIITACAEGAVAAQDIFERKS